jgi:spermidine synthase
LISARRAAALAFLTAGTTLFTQVLVHRVISAKLQNNYAFLVISLTMLGFAVSGALLSLLERRLVPRMPDVLVASAALFVVSLVVCSAVVCHADVGAQFPGSRAVFLQAAARWMPLAVLYAIPFGFCGLMLGLLLSAPDLPTRRVYFADLVGSGLGALVVIPAISSLGVERSLLAACAVLLVGTAVLVRPRGLTAWTLTAVAAAVVVAGAVAPGQLFRMRYPSGSILGNLSTAPPPYGLEYTQWDPVARIEVSRIPPPHPARNLFPCLIGANPDFHARFERLLTQNNYAFTYAVNYDGRVESLRGIEETIYSAAYQAHTTVSPRVMVIGVGGGFDVLTALAFDASRVVGVEINSATVDILTKRYRDYFRHWVTDPRLELVTGEGRHYLATHPETYDVLQLSGVDSYAGTAGAAHVFSENYLYTAEAFDLYLSRLRPDGVLNMMRLEYPYMREMVRALTTAVAALRRAGATRPADHIITVSAHDWRFTALLVKRTPFTVAEEDRVQTWAAPNPYLEVTASPRQRASTPNLYESFLALNDPRQEAAFIAAYPFDIAPSTDDRPFFFNYAFWSHLTSKDPVIIATVPTMEMSALLLAVLVGTAAVVCVVLPLAHVRRAASGLVHPVRWAIYFGGIAIGYLALEMALFQKFGLFLGHPNYALSVVLAALLVSTGLGSLASGAILSRLGPPRRAAYVLALIVFVEYFFAFPVLGQFSGLPLPARAAIVAILVAPIGIALGVFLPAGLGQLKMAGPSAAAWAWGVNGVFSVLAPIASVALSMTWGINALLLAAVPVYLVAALAMPDALPSRMTVPS